MKRFLLLASLACVVACGSDVAAPVKTDTTVIAGTPKPDPYITIRVTNGMDTTTAPGRAFWRYYLLLSGPDFHQNGIAIQGSYQIADLRNGQRRRCLSVAADSIGQRLIAPFAIADTTTEAAHSAAAYDSVVTRWYAGDHSALPAGFMVLTLTPFDAWDSAQYAAGHGLVPADPIKWAWDWTDSGTHAFTERVATDTTGCNQA